MKIHIKDNQVRLETLNELRLMSQEVELPLCHMLVIDDDPLFRKTVAEMARRRNISVVQCRSLKELEDSTLGDFDVAVVDYYLDGFKHDLKGTEVAESLLGTPTILVSNTEAPYEDSSIWPTAIQRFISKSVGPLGIVNEAFAMGQKHHKAHG